MPKYSFDHIHLISPEPLKTAEFYEKMFGTRRKSVEELQDGRTMIHIDLNGFSIGIYNLRADQTAMLRSAEVSYGLDHFGIHTDDIEATVATLKANGVKFRDEITQFAPGLKLAFFWGPDNTLVELLERSD